jgi:hypothetical protein
MGVISTVGNQVISAFKHARAKQDAVRDGKLDIVKTSQIVQGEDKIGRRVLWKKVGGRELLSTHGYSKQAGPMNFVRGNRLREESDFSNAVLKMARENRGSQNEDIKAAVGYILSDWQHADYTITEPLQRSLKLLADNAAGLTQKAN